MNKNAIKKNGSIKGIEISIKPIVLPTDICS